MYISAPIWGKLVDARGPRLLLVGAFVLLLAGYSGIRHIYDIGVPESDPRPASLSTFSFYALVLCSIMTGAGGNGGLTGSVNSTAKTFPDRAVRSPSNSLLSSIHYSLQRATTTGLVLSGFGLSAFLFSTVAHLAFAGDTSSFLLLLSLGTAFPMILGFFFVRPIPLPPSELVHGLEHGRVDVRHDEATAVNSSSIFQSIDDSQTRLLNDDESEETSSKILSNPPADQSPDSLASLELSPTRSSRSSRPSISRAAKTLHEGLPNIFGMQLWCTVDFWLLFTILSIRMCFPFLLLRVSLIPVTLLISILEVSGTGLMCASGSQIVCRGTRN